MRMRERWRALTGAESRPHEPSLTEAFGVWALGVMWAMTCLWLAYLGNHWLLPATLVAGLCALWGWRHAEWLWWFPGTIVLSITLESIAPLAGRARLGALLYADVLAVGVTVVALVRAIGLDRPLLPRTPMDRAMTWLLGGFAVTLLLPAARPSAFADVKAFITTGVVFYATVAIASGRGGARWAWLAFPLAAGLQGAPVLWALARDPGALAAGSHGAAELAVGAGRDAWTTLLVAVPMGTGLAVDAGQVPMRRVWTLAWLTGAVALVALSVAGAAPNLMRVDPLQSASAVVRTILGCAGLAALALAAWRVRRVRPHEGARWLAAGLAMMSCAAAVALGIAIEVGSRILLAIAAGLVVGTMRADRRTVFAKRAHSRRAVCAEAPACGRAAADRAAAQDGVPARAAAQDGVPAARAASQDGVPAAAALSVVIVSYRSQDALDGCLASLARARERIPLEIIVVDNASGDGTLDWVRATHPWVIALGNHENLGFAAGVNRGLAIARGELLLVLNPDCEITAAALETLVETARDRTGVAAFAPMLLDGGARPARSCGRFPDLWTLACDHLGLVQAFPRTRLFGGYKYGERPIESLDGVDWASGAALLIPRSAYDELGGFDEGMFMYMEEVDWCRRAARGGLVVRFVPAARIVHHGQMSSKQVPGETYLHNLRSRVYYFRKHHGAAAAQAAKAILVASLVLKWVLSGARATSRPLGTVYARGVEAVWMA